MEKVSCLGPDYIIFLRAITSACIFNFDGMPGRLSSVLNTISQVLMQTFRLPEAIRHNQLSNTVSHTSQPCSMPDAGPATPQSYSRQLFNLYIRSTVDARGALDA